MVTQTTHAPTAEDPAVQVSINGLQQTTRTPAGVVTAYTHDALGRPVSVLSESDNGARTISQTTVYNTLGQVESVEDAAGNKTWFAYDTAGRQSAVTNALGQVTTTLYDALGNVTNVTGATYPVSYGYDAWNRMVWMKTYRDENGAGDLTQWQHDLATGLVTNKVYANGKGTSYTYTPDGKLACRTWARGITTDYGYTIAGELASVDYSDTTPDVSYTHDRLGRPVTITDALGQRTFAYDATTLQLISETLPDGTILSRTTDAFGRPAGISVAGIGDPGSPGYAVTYGYDPAGRFGTVTTLAPMASLAVQYAYVQGSDLLAGWSSNVGTSFHRTFEPHRDLIASVTNAWNGVAMSSFAYTNDGIGRRTARVDSGLTQNSFGYNMRSEVIEAIMGTNTCGYAYDPIGNRIASTNNAATVGYTADLLNQYTNVVGAVSITPTYDDDGNMVAYGDRTFVWDGENRLIEVAIGGASVVQNQYDHMSRRTMNTTATATAAYVYDGWNLIREQTTSGGNSSTNHYVWGLDLSGTLSGAGGVGGLLAVVQNGETYFACADGNGNVTDYVDTNGTVVAHREYDPFGGTIALTGSKKDDFNFWFSTRYLDRETGLVMYPARPYSPTLGRFLSRDPAHELGGANLYASLHNDAINRIDPKGLLTLGELIEIIAVAVVDIYGEIQTDKWMDEAVFDQYGGREEFIKATTKELYGKGQLSGKMWEKAVAKDSTALNITVANQAQWANAVDLVKGSPAYKDRTDFIKQRLREGTADQGHIHIEFTSPSDLVYSIHGAQIYYDYKAKPCLIEFWISDTYNFDKNHAWKRLQREGRIVAYPVEIRMPPESFDKNAK